MANIFIDDDFRLKLGDFGVSSFIDKIRYGNMSGTIHYIAP